MISSIVTVAGDSRTVDLFVIPVSVTLKAPWRRRIDSGAAVDEDQGRKQQASNGEANSATIEMVKWINRP